MYVDVLGITMQHHEIFQSVTSPKVAKNPRILSNHNTAFKEQLLHITVAQREAIIEPDTMADDFPRKAVILVASGVGRRGHAWLPIHRFI
jgi:hypothetical protein